MLPLSFDKDFITLLKLFWCSFKLDFMMSSLHFWWFPSLKNVSLTFADIGIVLLWSEFLIKAKVNAVLWNYFVSILMSSYISATRRGDKLIKILSISNKDKNKSIYDYFE